MTSPTPSFFTFLAVPRCSLWASLLFSLSLASSALAETESGTIRSGHSGHWYDPARDGEGFALEILEDDGALLYWFTYDEEGRQRWMIATGQTEQGEFGEYLNFPSLIVTRGGRFGPEFDPAEVVREEVGSATLHFNDCDSGEFAFEAFDQVLSFPVQRLAHTMGMPCESRNGVPGRDSTELAGQSGSWFDMEHNGEGYSLQWMDPQRALLIWYSYDTEGEQYWMIGVGELDDQGQLQFPEVVATQGARFGSQFDPEDVERFDWGTLSLALGCDNGNAQYNSVLVPFGQGDFNLQRLTQPRGLSCPYHRPTLTDLYEVIYEPISLTAATPNTISVLRLANDGTLYGSQRSAPDPQTGESITRLARLLPDQEHWEILPNGEVNPSFPILVSSDGHQFGRHEIEFDENGDPVRLHFEVRLDEQDWASPDPDLSRVEQHARNFSAFAGGGSSFGFPSNSPAWRWTPELGLEELPSPPDASFYQPVTRAVSSDAGRIVLGTLYAPDTQQGWRTRSLRWVDGGEPESLLDLGGAELGSAQVCDADCSLIFGAGQAFLNLDHPNDRQAWFWRSSGDMGYLGSLDVDLGDDYTLGKYGIVDTSADGSLAAGAFVSSTVLNSNREALLWTQRTGLVSVGALIQDLAIDEVQLWSLRTTKNVTDDGERVLLSGTFVDEFGGQSSRAAILYLTPRSMDW